MFFVEEDFHHCSQIINVTTFDIIVDHTHRSINWNHISVPIPSLMVSLPIWTYSFHTWLVTIHSIESRWESNAATNIRSKSDRRALATKHSTFPSCWTSSYVCWIITILCSSKYEIVGFETKPDLWTVSFGKDDTPRLFDHVDLITIKLSWTKTSTIK
jgi:hypothetical protein